MCDVCMASLSLCHYQARGHLSPAPGPHLLQLQRQTKHARVNMERGEGRSQAAMSGEDLPGTEYNDNENIQEQVFGNLCQCVD